jgi:hypothetical protein
MDIYIYIIATVVSFVCGLVIGLTTGIVSTIKKLDSEKYDDFTPIEKLKNALLTFALVDIKMNDMAGLNLNYPDYKGDKYPALSGSSITDACYTYIFNRNAFRNNLMYTKTYENKLDAIEKYLKKNLNTEKQTYELLTSFCEKHKKCIDNDEDKDKDKDKDE